jgi:bifunctional non-homologous end joining protein LigD
MVSKAFEFSLPTLGKAVPDTPAWIHEIKFDGYRIRVVREDKKVRLFTMNGADYTDRYPWIIEAARKIKASQFILDGEAVVLDLRSYSDFDALASREYDDEVQLYAFDILALDGDDLTKLPLSMRKTNLEQLLRRRPEGIQLAPYEPGETGPDLFHATCEHGLEGIVSKRLDRAYKYGRCEHWLKSKNRNHPAFERVKEVHARASRLQQASRQRSG